MCVGDAGKPAEKVGEEAADALIEADAAGGCVDEYVLPPGVDANHWRRANR